MCTHTVCGDEHEDDASHAQSTAPGRRRRVNRHASPGATRRVVGTLTSNSRTHDPYVFEFRFDHSAEHRRTHLRDISMALRTQAKASDPICPPHTPHALACSPPPGVLSLAFWYASAVPPTRRHFLTQSTHVADQQQTESLLPVPPPACHKMMKVPKKVPRPSTFTHGQHDARGCRATP